MSLTTTQDGIQFTRINNDTNGNPRYVCHFLNFITDKDPQYPADRYGIALTRARKIGGRKFHNKQYGGGIVFQSYSLPELTKAINELMAQYVPPKFLNDWNESQFKDIEKAIVKHFHRYSTNEGIKYARTWEELDKVLGLAYTSSSSYAMYSICNGINVHSKHVGYNYTCFSIGEDGKFYAILDDKEENEKIILL